jgi:hypothetical protein
MRRFIQHILGRLCWAMLRASDFDKIAIQLVDDMEQLRHDPLLQTSRYFEEFRGWLKRHDNVLERHAAELKHFSVDLAEVQLSAKKADDLPMDLARRLHNLESAMRDNSNDLENLIRERGGLQAECAKVLELLPKVEHHLERAVALNLKAEKLAGELAEQLRSLLEP